MKGQGHSKKNTQNSKSAVTLAFLIVGGSDLVYRNPRGKTVILHRIPISVQRSGLDVKWRQSLVINVKHTICLRNLFLCTTIKFCRMNML